MKIILRQVCLAAIIALGSVGVALGQEPAAAGVGSVPADSAASESAAVTLWPKVPPLWQRPALQAPLSNARPFYGPALYYPSPEESSPFVEMVSAGLELWVACGDNRQCRDEMKLRTRQAAEPPGFGANLVADLLSDMFGGERLHHAHRLPSRKRWP